MAANSSARSSDSVDRVLLGVCTLIWLAAIGVGVAAIVVLVDMGTGRHTNSGEGSHTPWLLYAVIVVSALIIAGAIPLLVRARRTAQSLPARGRISTSAPRGVPAPVPPGTPAEMRTEKVRMFGSIADPIDGNPSAYHPPRRAPQMLPGGLTEAVERVWLRGTVILAGAMGIAMLAVTSATYLMGIDNDTTAWMAYGLAAVITVVMPAIPFSYLRRLRSVVMKGRRAQRRR